MPTVDLENYTPAQAREHWGYQLAQYTPPTDSVIIDVDVDFVTRPITPPIHLVQYDKVLPVLAIHMYSNRSAYTMPQQSTAAIRVNNGNGTYYYAFAEGRSADFTTVYFQLQAALCLDPGFKPGVIEISNSEGLVNSSPIQIEVEQNPMPEDAIISSADYINLRQLIDGVEKWAYGDCQHLTNNSWIVTGSLRGSQIGTAATAEGGGNVSSGAYSHTEGQDNTASASCAHAEGTGTTASGAGSHAEGSGNVASAANAHAEGTGGTASGINSHSEGGGCRATGLTAHAEGSGTAASGQAAHSEGNSTTASGNYSHAEGSGTTAEAIYSHSEGYNCTAIDDTNSEASHAEGYGTQARGRGAHAEGYGNLTTSPQIISKATSSGAHAEGFGCSATADCAHAEGHQTTASGAYSHAEGWWGRAGGASSHVSGSATIADYEDQFAIGRFNQNVQGDIFEIGNGTSSARKNIFTVKENGDILTRRQFAIDVASEEGLEYSFKNVMETMIFGVYHSFPAYEAPSALTAVLTPTAAIPAGSYGTFSGNVDIPFSTFDKGPLCMLASGNVLGFTVENFEVNEWVNISTGSDRDISLLTTEYIRTVPVANMIRLAISCNVHNNSAKQVPTSVELRMSINAAIRYMLKQS